jgi:hypothetical protein
VNELADFVGRLVRALDAAGAPYMIAGSVASTFHGAPRTTQDVDLVVELDGARMRSLLQQLPEEQYYVSEDAARDAIRRRGQFNVIDMATGWKADLIVRKARPFSEEEFGRRQRVSFAGVDVWIASAEDTIVSKLEWSRASGGSERQLNDVHGILASKGAQLDRAYVETWVRDLGLQELWSRATQP